VKLKSNNFATSLIPFYGVLSLVIRPATTIQLLAKSELILLSIQQSPSELLPGERQFPSWRHLLRWV